MAKALEIRAQCVRKGLTLEELSNKMGVNYTTLYRKMHGSSDFSREEILSIKNVLELSDDQVMDIFFAK